MFLIRVLVVFAFKVLEEVLRLFLRAASRRSFEGLTPEQRVHVLEQQRQARGYRPGWLYHRSREEGLEGEYQRLRAGGYVR